LEIEEIEKLREDFLKKQEEKLSGMIKECIKFAKLLYKELPQDKLFIATAQLIDSLIWRFHQLRNRFLLSGEKY
jgi:arsenate reductase-like glutaredoxin family protein